MCVVLVPNIGISTRISNATQIRPQHFRNFMCVHWECAWCQCQILVLAPAYPTLHKYAHSTSETSCVSTGNVRGASAKYWSQNYHIENYTKTYSTSETLCVCTGNVHGAKAKFRDQHQHIQHYTNTPVALQKLHVCALGMCMVLVKNFGLRTTTFNTTEKRPQHVRNFMRLYWECAWCQCQILVLEPPYKTLRKYTHSSSETSCAPPENVHGASAKFWSLNHHIQHYTNTPIGVQKLNVFPLGMCMVLIPNICIGTSISNSTQKRPQYFRNFMHVHRECAWCQGQILVLEPPYPKLHKYTHSNSETSCVPTGYVHGAIAKYWLQNHHIQHYTNMPTAVQKLHACACAMCIVLVPNFGISTSIFNTTQIRPQQFRNFMCLH